MLKELYRKRFVKGKYKVRKKKKKKK